MRVNVVAVIAAAAIALVAPLVGQTPSVFPALDVRVPVPPRPFTVAGTTYLVYELHVTNLSAQRTTLERIEVADRAAPQNAPPLLRLESAALDAALVRPGAPPDDPARRVLPGGRMAILFAWIAVPSAAAPAALTHRFAVRVAPPGAPSASAATEAAAGDGFPLTVSGVEVAVAAGKPPILDAPLEGDLWLAANGPDNAVGHRRTLLALAGQARIAQRYAVDWVRLHADGRTFRGDPRMNASYRAFGARVFAVADGVVADIVDGIPDNVPDPVARAVPITPATLGGNYVLLELADETFVVYAHLQAGSLQVKKGERVRRGQVLGLVGNTGNSSEPHLHFQVADRRTAFDAEGVPYGLASFDLQADPAVVTPAIVPVGGSLGIDASALAGWTAAPAQRRTGEMPLLNAIVRFDRLREPGP